MEPGETLLVGLEMRKMMKCNGVAVKPFHLLMFVSTLMCTVVVVGLADNAGVALAGGVKVVIPDGGQIERDSTESMQV